jgi:hypothetical protein
MVCRCAGGGKVARIVDVGRTGRGPTLAAPDEEDAMTARKDSTPPSGGKKDEKNRTRERGADARTPGQEAKGRDEKRPGSQSNPDHDE